MMNKYHAAEGSFDKSQIEKPTPESGIQGTRGVWNARRASGLVRRSTMTAKQMTTKAESVPIFTNCAISLIGNNPATKAVSTPAMRVGRWGVR